MDSYEVSSGVVSSGLTLEGGDMYVYEGGSVLGTVYADMTFSDGRVYSSGNVVANTKIADSKVYLLGAVVNGGKVYSGGVEIPGMTVSGEVLYSAGEQVQNAIVSGNSIYFAKWDIIDDKVYVPGVEVVNSGAVYVSGGIVSAALLNGGMMDVVSSGSAEFIVANDAEVCVSGGGAVSSAWINGGTMDIADGIASDVSARDNADVTVYEGGSGNSVELNNAAMNVSGGKVYGIDVLSGAHLNVYTSGSAGNVLVSGGFAAVFDGGKIFDLSVKRGGYVDVSAGAVVSNVTMSGGYVGVIGGELQGNAVVSNGELVMSGGSAANITVSGGYVHVSQGAAVSNATAVSSGRFYVSSGANVTDAKVSSGGFIAVYSSGSAGKVSLGASGGLYISSGATVGSLNWTPGDGTLVIEQGANVATSKYSGVYWGSNGVHVGSYGGDNVITTQEYYDLASATAGAGASLLYLQPYSPSCGSNLLSGEMYVMNGGQVFGVPVTSGDMHVWGGGSGAFLQVDGGRLFASGGASVYGAIVTGNGNFDILSNANVLHYSSYGYKLGGAALGYDVDAMIKEQAAAKFQSLYNDVYIFDNSINYGGVAVLGGGNINITSGAKVVGGAMAGIGGTLNVQGEADKVLLHNGGVLRVSGGTVDKLESYRFTHSATYFDVYDLVSSGTINNNSDSYTNSISSNYFSSSKQQTAAGQAYIFSGGKISGSGEYGIGADVYVMNGGTLTDVDITGDFIYSGIITSSAASQEYKDSKNHSSVVSNTNNNYVVTSNVTHIESHHIYEVNSGTVHVFSGGKVSNVRVGGTLNVSGGTATDLTLGYTLEYGQAQSAAMKGAINVASGGRIENINFGNNSGLITVSSGGVIAGSLRLNARQLKFETGGILDFAVSKQNPGQDYLVKGYRYIQGSPTITITVDEYQANGTYLLAHGAETYKANSVISVQGIIDDNIVSFGRVSANGDALAYNTKFYALKFDGSSLSLEVSSGDLLTAKLETPSVEADVTSWTNGSVTVTAEFTPVAIKRMYRLETDGKNDWKDYIAPVTVSQNTSIYFMAVDSIGRESEVCEYKVDNIDTTAPTFSVVASGDAGANADEPEKLSENVYVSVKDMFDFELDAFGNTVGGSGIARIEYSFDEGKDKKWVSGSTVKVTKANIKEGELNCTVYFRVVDNAGNEAVSEGYLVDTIGDTLAPVVTVTGVPAAYTNGDVILTIEVAEQAAIDSKNDSLLAPVSGIVKIEYAIVDVDSVKNPAQEWVAVSEEDITFNEDRTSAALSLTFSENKEVYLRAYDKAGNVFYYNDGNSIRIDKLDKAAPKLTIAPVSSAWDNKDVSIVITAEDTFDATSYPVSSGLYQLQYFLDSEWVTLSTKEETGVFTFDFTHVVSGTGNHTYRVVDHAGNISEEYVAVVNIDKVDPTVSLSQDVTDWTNGNVVINAVAGDEGGSGVKLVEYQLNGVWTAGTSMTVSSNGTYSFRVTDNAGNVFVAEHTVSNIDRIDPTITFGQDVTDWTNGDVVITAAGSDEGGSGVKLVEYQLNGVWTAGTSLTVSSNGTYSFRVTDNAGNVFVTGHTVSNIDKVIPAVTVSGNPENWTNKDVTISISVSDELSGVASTQYSLNGTDWVNGTSFTVAANGTYYVKVTDKAGNIATKDVVVSRIDKVNPEVMCDGIPDVWINKDSTLKIIASDADSGIASTWYSYDKKDWYEASSFTASYAGTYYVKAIDKAGNETVKPVEIVKIDKIDPTITFGQDVTDWTNGDVVITAAGSDEGGSGVKLVEYQLNGVWTAGTSLTVSSNGTYSFRVTDNAGNVFVTGHTVSNIDKVIPAVTISGNPENWTNKDVTISISVSDELSGVASTQYSLNGTDWVNGTSFTVAANGTYYVKVTDNAGNIATKDVVVSMIDKVNPTVSATGNLTVWTKEVVLTVAASDGEGSGVAETLYSVNGSDWQSVTGNTVSVGTNGTVSFKTVDAVGNVSDIFTVDINNIDITGPEVISFSGNPTAWTNKNVKITAYATDSASGVAAYYYRDASGNWVAGQSLDVSVNGTYTFKVVDRVGNESIKDVVVSMIDVVAPTVSVTGNAAEWTNSDVELFISVSDEESGVVSVEYSFDDKNWTRVNGSSIIIKENKTVYVRATDDAGNIGTAAPVQVTKIDKDIPVITVSGNPESWINTSAELVVSAADAGCGVDKLEYSFDNTTWFIIESGAKVAVDANTTVYVKATDKLGQIATQEVVVSMIDKVDPEITVNASSTEWGKEDVILSVAATDSISSIAKVEYSFDNQTWVAAGDTVTVTKNGTVSFRAYDYAGNEYKTTYTVSNIDKDAPVLTVSKDIETPTRRNVQLTAVAEDVAGGSGLRGIEYSFDNKVWFTGSSVSVSENQTVYFRAIDNCGNISTETVTVSNILDDKGASNLLSNGMSQIVAWDAKKGTVGYVAVDGDSAPDWRGVWEWNRGEALMWKVVGVGHFAGSNVTQDGILLYNGFNNTFAAWTDLGSGDYGYVSLSYVDGEFSTKCLANFDNDKYDDVLIYDKNGSFGIVLDGTTYHDIWHSESAEANPWELMGAGSFGGSSNKLVVKNDSGHLYLWTNNDASFRTWDWSQQEIGYLGNDWEFVAIGDFAGDGTDDIVVRKLSDKGLWVWENGDSSTAHWVGTPDEGFAVEAVGDYNGDGKDDLLLREHKTGWGGVGYWASADASKWSDLDARIETGFSSNFSIIA